MKKIILILLSVVLLITPLTTNALTTDVSKTSSATAKNIVNAVKMYAPNQSHSHRYFNDIDDHWAEGYILALNAAGVAKGGSNSTFRPDRKVTWVEFLAFTLRLMDIPFEATTDKWFYGVLESAAENGLLDQQKKDTLKFYTHGFPINRGDMAEIIIKVLGVSPIEGETDFDDNQYIYDKKGYVNKIVELGIMKGYYDNTFRADGHLTRAEFAEVLVRVAELMAGEEVGGLDLKKKFAKPPREDGFIEPELGIVYNTKKQEGAYYFSIVLNNVEKYDNSYLFKAECINIPDFNTMPSYNFIERRAFTVDLTYWQDIDSIKKSRERIISLYAPGNEKHEGKEAIYKITVKKGDIEEEYFIAGLLFEQYFID